MTNSHQLINCSPPLPRAAVENARKSDILTYTSYKSSKKILFPKIISDSYRKNIQQYPLKKEMFYRIPKGPFFETKLEGVILFAGDILIAPRDHIIFENDLLRQIFLKKSSP
jgi:hypothetical protein